MTAHTSPDIRSIDDPKNLDVLVKALSATRGAVTIADARAPDMPLIYFNQAFMQLTGYSEHEMLQKNCRFLQGEDTEQDVVNEIRQAVKNQTDVKVVLKNYRKDGTPFWNDLMMSPVFDKTGKLTHYIGLQLDITLKVEREERERIARELELENVHLKKEADMLARLNVVKDDFISIASHQLRTPATIVKQNLGMLTEGYLGELDEKQLKAVTTAYESNDRLIKIINELLRHARMSANEYGLKESTVDIAELLRSVHASYAQRNKNLHRTFGIDDEGMKSVLVRGDAELLRSAIENLVDNAVEYSYDASKICLKLTQDASTVRVAVLDEGVGIRPEDKPKLFKKFSRIQTDHRQNIGGTGLGLFWVKTVVDMHSGSVEVRDNVPTGSVFTISLPKI